jgi:hypothetical protein
MGEWFRRWGYTDGTQFNGESYGTYGTYNKRMGKLMMLDAKDGLSREEE